MIKRIKTIANLGRFRHLSAASLEFGRMTFVCGENALGKSTLADILSCLETRDASLMELRRTLPKDARAPFVAIGIAEGDAAEVTIEYRGGAWHVPDAFAVRLAVFDDGFQSRNVFTGRVFDRENREQFTSFVLGYEGVALAGEIGAKKADLARTKRRGASLAADVFRGVDDLQGFLAMVPDAPADTLEAEVRSLEGELADLRNRWKRASRFAERRLPTTCPSLVEATPLAARVASILRAALPDTLRAARESVQEHAARTFIDAAGAELWIREGLRQNRGEVCQLCGQGLSEEALRLFSVYEDFFSEEYAAREAEVRLELPRLVAALAEAGADRYRSAVEQNDLILTQYADCDGDSEFQGEAARFTDAGRALVSAETRYRAAVSEFRGPLAAAVQRKSLSPMTGIAPPEADAIEESETALRDAVFSYDTAVSAVTQVILRLKASATPDRLEEEGRRLAAAKESRARALRRLELAPEVEEYEGEARRVRILESEIDGLQKRLGEEQSVYLEAYFERLNHYFRRFGSRDFELRKRVDYRGHLPVVSMEVLFRGARVPDARVEHLFSASDRRALALSVFWAQVYGLPDCERDTTILVLDDPVTSFDEHRIASHNAELVRASRDFRQVLVLTHFRDQVARYFQAYRAEGPRLLALQRDGDTTKLVPGDLDGLLGTEHERARRRLFEFADGKAAILDVPSMRVFFEKEIEHRFAHQLDAHEISGETLAERIDGMAAAGILPPAIAREAHDWRLRLNPEHHCWVGATLEDQRNTVAELREFIYGPLNAGGSR